MHEHENGLETNLRETSKLVIDSTNGLLDRLLERAPDTHHLAHRLHAAAEQPADTVELLQIPARDLDDDIVQARLEACARDLRDRVPDLVERNAEAELRSDERERVAGSLGCESGRPRQTSVHLGVHTSQRRLLDAVSVDVPR